MKNPDLTDGQPEAPEETRRGGGPFVPPDKAGYLLDKSTSWLAKKRMTGDGPPYIKIGRSVLYDVDELVDWARRHRRMSTSEPG